MYNDGINPITLRPFNDDTDKPNAHREYAENDIGLNKMSLERLWGAGMPVLRKIKNHLPTSTVVALRMKEFSSLCPVKGFPDYAEIAVDFTLPAKSGNFIEQKSLRDFLNEFRQKNTFQEEATAFIFDAIQQCIGVEAGLVVDIAWVGRGGISNRVVVKK